MTDLDLTLNKLTLEDLNGEHSVVLASRRTSKASVTLRAVLKIDDDGHSLWFFVTSSLGSEWDGKSQALSSAIRFYNKAIEKL